MNICLIFAVADDGTIGDKGQRPWRQQDDEKYFKDLTIGHTVIMGRKTYESIGRPLKNRRNIVISREPSYKADGCTVVSSPDEAIETCRTEQQVFVIGGAEIFKLMEPVADRAYVTRIHSRPDGDTKYDIKPESWRLDSTETHPTDSLNTNPYTYQIYTQTNKLLGCNFTGHDPVSP